MRRRRRELSKHAERTRKSGRAIRRSDHAAVRRYHATFGSNDGSINRNADADGSWHLNADRSANGDPDSNSKSDTNSDADGTRRHGTDQRRFR